MDRKERNEKIIKGLIGVYFVTVAIPLGLAMEIVKIPYYILDKLANKRISKCIETALENAKEERREAKDFKITNFRTPTLTPSYNKHLYKKEQNLNAHEIAKKERILQTFEKTK